MVKDTIVRYAVLRYVPDIEREEFVNIGVAVHHPASSFLNLLTTSAFSRLRAFDDEADIQLFKDIIADLKDEFNSNGLYGPSQYELTQPDLLVELTRHYVNQIQFSDVRTLITKNLGQDVDDLFRTYVYYETTKGRRITQTRVKSLLSQTFKHNEIHEHMVADPTIKGKFGEDIQLDYGYQSTDFIKSFALNYRRDSNNIDTARTWAHTFSELRDVARSHGQNPEFISVVHFDSRSKSVETALEILDSTSNVYYLEEVDRLAVKLKKRIHEQQSVQISLRI